jgi:hypothetical protein
MAGSARPLFDPGRLKPAEARSNAYRLETGDQEIERQKNRRSRDRRSGERQFREERR